MSNGKWIYNISSDEEHWDCEEEFDTKEEAIAAGIEFFTVEHVEYYGEPFEGACFSVGQKIYPTIAMCGASAIERIYDTAYWDCGDVADGWLENVSSEQEESLEKMLTEVVQKWLKDTDNEPTFYGIVKVDKVDLSYGK